MPSPAPPEQPQKKDARMGELSGDRRPFDAFAYLIAQRQIDEARRREARLPVRTIGRSADLAPRDPAPLAYPGLTSAPSPGSESVDEPTGSDIPTLLQIADTVAPPQPVDRPPPVRRVGPVLAASQGSDDRLLNSADGPDFATPLLLGTALAAPFEVAEALSGPVGWALLLGTLGLQYALRPDGRPGDRQALPKLPGSRRGQEFVPAPATASPPGFPGTPVAVPPLPPPLPPDPPDEPRIENIPAEIDRSVPPFPALDDDLVGARIKAGSKTPWADAYPEILDWLKNTVLENSKGSDLTQEEVETIIGAYVEAFKKWCVSATHTSGGSLREMYYPDPATGKTGSGRPDGSFEVGPDRQQWDFNHHDTWKDGATPTAREARAQGKLERLQEAHRQKLAEQEGFLRPRSQFDMFPKSRNFTGPDWGAFIRQRIAEIMTQRFGPPPE
jgi:hypothetical protein